MKIIRLSEKQRLAFGWWAKENSAAYDAVICDGAVRSGKTLSLSLGFVVWATTCFDGESFAICGKTVTSLRRNIVVPLVERLKSIGFACVEKVSKDYIDIGLEGVVNRFYLFGGKDEGSASLIQGITLAGVFLDEVALMPRSFVEQAIARCSVNGSKLWFSCNPDSPSHWFYNEWIKKAGEKNALYIHFTMEDNPALSEKIRKRYTKMYSGVFYDRFIKGIWTASCGLVYPMFGKNNITDEAPECERFYISCDYGTVNPSSFGLWGEHDGKWFRLSEYYYDSKLKGQCRTDEEHYCALEALAGKHEISAVIVDPSAASFIECIKRHGKFRVLHAKNEVIGGIRRVSDCLKNETLCFCSCCRDSIREFSLYSWNEKSEKDAPMKENDHAMDDIRYFVATVLNRGNENAVFAVSILRNKAE